MNKLSKIEQHLALAPKNRVRVNDTTFFRNTCAGYNGSEDLGDDIHFVHNGTTLRRFAKEIHPREKAPYYGFTHTDFSRNPNDARKIGEAFVALEEALLDCSDTSDEVNLEDF